MLHTPQRDTPCELALRKELYRRGWRFRVNYRPLPESPRRADIVFVKRRVAVFVDGCFWHSCPVHATFPKANRRWWADKLGQNRLRDRHTNKSLRNAGWKVVRIWEHEDTQRAAEKVIKTLIRRTSSLG